MAITPITEDELPNSESRAVSDLKEGTGIKFPCRWKHHCKTNQCYGASNLRAKTRGMGHITNFTCKDGTVYAWRPKVEVNPDDNPIPSATD